MLVDKEGYILDEDLWAKFQWGIFGFTWFPWLTILKWLMENLEPPQDSNNISHTFSASSTGCWMTSPQQVQYSWNCCEPQFCYMSLFGGCWGLKMMIIHLFLVMFKGMIWNSPSLIQFSVCYLLSDYGIRGEVVKSCEVVASFVHDPPSVTVDYCCLAGGNSKFFWNFAPKFGKIPNLTNIFQWGWKPQLDYCCQLHLWIENSFIWWMSLWKMYFKKRGTNWWFPQPFNVVSSGGHSSQGQNDGRFFYIGT